MNKYEEELKEIAKAYCKKMGYEFIFSNDYKFGFQDKNGSLWTLHFIELEEKLKELNKKEDK